MQENRTNTTKDQLNTKVTRRRFLSGAAGVAAAVPVAGLLPASAANAASGRSHRPTGSTVKVDVTAQKLTITPSRIPAGVVHLDVSTPDAASIAPGLLRLKGGVDIDTFLDHYIKAYSTDLETKRKYTAIIEREADFFGGAAVTSVGPVRTTAILRPGRYYLFNYNAALTPYLRDSVVPLQVGPGHSHGCLPKIDDVILLCGSGPGSQFVMSDRIPGHGTFLVSNLTRQINEAMWLRIADNATEDDVREFWAAVRAGQRPPKPVILSAPEGLAPMNSGFSGIVTTAMPPGRYMITTFMYDRQTWVKGVFEGFWKLITLY